jgi:hypothetical protein
VTLEQRHGSEGTSDEAEENGEGRQDEAYGIHPAFDVPAVSATVCSGR